MIKLMKWCVRSILVLTGIIPLFRCSSGYKGKDGKITFDGKEVAGKDLIVLNDAFAKDSATAYYKGRAFEYADVPSFAAMDDHYAKDKDKVYYCDEYREGQNYYLTKKQTIVTVKAAHPATFKTIGNNYGKDHALAFFKADAFTVKDIQSFRSINEYFSADDRLAYFTGVPIDGSHGKTFELIDMSYAKDTVHVYYYRYHTEGNEKIFVLPCNVTTFIPLDYPYCKDDQTVFYDGKKIPGVSTGTWKLLSDGYSKDGFSVYYHQAKIAGADANTFEPLKENENNTEIHAYAKDKAAVFFNGQKINGADVASFKVLTLGYSSDARQVYYKSRLVKDAHVESFKTAQYAYGDEDATDTNHKYLAGKRLAGL